jgi:hypothetical protein
MSYRNPVTQWVDDFRWAMNAMRARRYRRGVGFSERIRFDDALRPHVKNGVIAYPDAVYHITVEDVIRAMRKSRSSSERREGP